MGIRLTSLPGFIFGTEPGTMAQGNHVHPYRVEVPNSGTLTESQLTGTIITNYGQTVANTQICPSFNANMNGIVQIETSGMGAFYLKPNAGNRIGVSEGGVITYLTAGNKVGWVAPSVGNSFSFKTIRTGATTYDMIIYPNEGTLVDGGA